MDIGVVGIDLGKNTCSLAGLDALGRVVLRRRMRRDALGALSRVSGVALWRWRRAAARTIWAGGLPLRDTRSA
jgi:hypothetical protein